MGEKASSPKIVVHGLDLFYGPVRALSGVSVDIQANQITALIGPSGCGKSTFLRCLNRMNDTIPGTRLTGEILLDGEEIYAPDVDVVDLRRRVGMVFKKPNPFPQSVFDNVAFGPRVLGLAGSRADLEQRVVTSLQRAAISDVVKDDLTRRSLHLSLG